MSVELTTRARIFVIKSVSSAAVKVVVPNSRDAEGDDGGGCGGGGGGGGAGAMIILVTSCQSSPAAANTRLIATAAAVCSPAFGKESIRNSLPSLSRTDGGIGRVDIGIN